MKVKWHGIKYNFFMSIILKISNIIFPFVTTAYVARVLGPIGNGKISFASSVISYFLMFAQLGIPTYGIRVCAQNRENEIELKHITSDIIRINFIMVGLSYVVLICSFFRVPKFQEEAELLIIQSVTLFLNALGMEWFYQAIEQYSYIVKRNILFKIIAIVLMFVFVKSTDDYVIYGAISIFASSASYITNFIHSRRYIKLDFSQKIDFKRHMKPIWIFFAVTVASAVYTNMDSIMLGFISGDAQVGYYNIATKIKYILFSIAAALGSVILPRISNYVSNKNLYMAYRLLEKSLHFVVIFSFTLTFFFVGVAEETIMVLAGDKYAPAILVMKVVMFAVVPLAVGNVACAQILAPFGMEKYTMYSTTVGAIMNFIINYIYIPECGAVGAAIGTVIAEIVVCTIQIYFAREHFKIIIRNINVFKIIGCNVVAFIFMRCVKNVLISNPLFVLIVSFVVYVFILLILFFMLREKLCMEVLWWLKEKMKKV